MQRAATYLWNAPPLLASGRTAWPTMDIENSCPATQDHIWLSVTDQSTATSAKTVFEILYQSNGLSGWSEKVEQAWMSRPTRRRTRISTLRKGLRLKRKETFVPWEESLNTRTSLQDQATLSGGMGTDLRMTQSSQPGTSFTISGWLTIEGFERFNAIPNLQCEKDVQIENEPELESRKAKR